MNRTISKLEIHEIAPVGFDSRIQIAACYLEINNKLLFLQRAHGKLEFSKWGVPAGKLEINECPDDAAKRELFEETGISIQDESCIEYLKPLYIRKPEVDYVYHLFKIKLDHMPEVLLSDEHQNYVWATSQDIETITLMDGAIETLEYYKSHKLKKRTGATVNAYLILKKDHQILLHLRKNTGYCDGMWSLVASHVENGEATTAALIRETFEEIGIQLYHETIKVVHVMHRQTNRFNIDIFFECSNWEGIIQNCEPEKCEKLEFFSLDDLPKNIIEYIAEALKAIKNGQFYSEHGWNV